jgi:pimeloyl-ACP methyl ester carboxylesterase
MKYLLLLLLIGEQAFCQKSIDTSMSINVGGIKQYIRLKGKDISKPMLLFLHGGPGGSLMQKTDQMTGKLQQHFVIVQWDQRETGETLKRNKSPKPLTLQLFYDDTHEMIDTLLTRYNKPKLYLAGYSWGTGMGFYIADKFPGLLYAYIAISPVIYQAKSDSISLAILRQWGSKPRKELANVKIPFENADQLYYHRKWLYKYDGQKLVSLILRRSIVQSWAATWFDVWTRSCEVNLFESMPSFNCPIYFFAGGQDLNTNASITEQYYKKISAPKKNLFLFEEVGHTLPETNSGRFQDMIINKILPETLN